MMSTKKMKNPPHPGKILKHEFLDKLGINQSTLARHVGWYPQQVNLLVRGQGSITAKTAQKLAQALGTTPEFWMNLQTAYSISRLSKRKPLARLAAKKGAKKPTEVKIKKPTKAKAKKTTKKSTKAKVVPSKKAKLTVVKKATPKAKSQKPELKLVPKAA